MGRSSRINFRLIFWYCYQELTVFFSLFILSFRLIVCIEYIGRSNQRFKSSRRSMGAIEIIGPNPRVNLSSLTTTQWLIIPPGNDSGNSFVPNLFPIPDSIKNDKRKSLSSYLDRVQYDCITLCFPLVIVGEKYVLAYIFELLYLVVFIFVIYLKDFQILIRLGRDFIILPWLIKHSQHSA